MAETYNTANSIGKVRLYSKDTNISSVAFTDVEWQVFIDGSPSSNLRLAAAWGLRTLAFDTARSGRWIEAKVSAIAPSTVAIQLAEWLEEQAASVDGISSESSASYLVAPWAGGISIASKDTYDTDTDRVMPAFSRTTFQHPGTTAEADDE